MEGSAPRRGFDDCVRGGAKAMAKSDWARAIAWFSRALKLQEHHSHSANGNDAGQDEKPVLAGIHAQLGQCYQQQHDMPRAMFHHKADLQISRLIGDTAGQARAFKNLGDCFRVGGMVERSVQAYQKHVALVKESSNGNAELEGRAHDILANAYHRLGNECSLVPDFSGSRKFQVKDPEQFNRAVNFYRKRLRTDQDNSEIYAHLGTFHERREEHEAAGNCFEKQIELAKEAKDPMSLRRALRSLGIVHVRRGMFNLALDFFKKELEESRSDGDKHGEAAALKSIAKTCEMMNFSDGAVEHYQELLSCLKTLSNPIKTSRALIDVGKYYMILKRNDEAKDMFLQAIDFAKDGLDIVCEQMAKDQLLRVQEGDEGTSADEDTDVRADAVLTLGSSQESPEPVRRPRNRRSLSPMWKRFTISDYHSKSSSAAAGPAVELDSLAVGEEADNGARAKKSKSPPERRSSRRINALNRVSSIFKRRSVSKSPEPIHTDFATVETTLQGGISPPASPSSPPASPISEGPEVMGPASTLERLTGKRKTSWS
eukprot:m.103672 g.103672  ORF g.103672 m.103672 type:complete len:543 (-) comp13818_c0_seq3:1221-2849(-)